MRFARLSADKRAIVLAAARSPMQRLTSLQRCGLFPDGLCTGKVTSMVAPVETEEPYFPEDEPAFENDEVLSAEGFNAEDLGEEPIEEQDAVDILMTWKQTRNQINRERTNRGLATNADIRKMEARVRVNFVGMVKDEAEPIDPNDEIILVLQSWSSRPRDYWWVGGGRVIREHVVPRSSMF